MVKGAVDQWVPTLKQPQWFSEVYPQAIAAQDGNWQMDGSQSLSFRQRSCDVWQKYPKAARPVPELATPSIELSI